MKKKPYIKQYYKTCYHCHREWVSCEVRTCPVKQKPVCRICCMKCPKHTIEEIGVGCEVIKENHEKEANSTRENRRAGERHS